MLVRPERLPIILLLIKDPKLGNEGIDTYITYRLGPGLGSISDLKFTGVGRVPRNERLVYTKCSVSQKLRARENSECRYHKITREGKFKMTIHNLSNKIWMQPVWRKGFRDVGFFGSYRRGEIRKHIICENIKSKIPILSILVILIFCSKLYFPFNSWKIHVDPNRWHPGSDIEFSLRLTP